MDGNCPSQPFPVDFPPTDKLPEEIQDALKALDKLANSSINPVTVVKSLVNHNNK